MLFLGIDGGGSTCRAVVIDEFDKTVFQGQGGASNFSSTPARTLRRSVARALEAAPKVDQICGCFAGLINSEARDRARELVGTLLPDCPITLTADYAAALRASPPDTTACLIAGTGSIVCSITPEGYVKSGGGGPLLGDEGSGFAYGRHAIRQFLRTGSGSEKFLEEIEKRIGSCDPNEVLGRVYASSSPAALVAGFSSFFFKDLGYGAEYAKIALKTETDALARTVVSHLDRYHSSLSQPIISLAGSIWKRKAARNAFERTIDVRARCVVLEKPPVLGAALLARDIFMREKR